MSAKKPQLFPLTGLRFFLALWVVVFHQASPEGYLGAWMPHFPEPVYCLLRTGYVAVGVFFVLSGFILSYNYSLATSWSSPQVIRFATARFARIYPAYCVGLLLVAPFVGYPLVKTFSLDKMVKESATAALNWTLLQSWIPRTASTWNAPGWSLSAEAFFYCCFPFVGVAVWRLSCWRGLLIAGSGIWVAALAAPSLAVSVPLSGFGNISATEIASHADPFWGNLITFNPLLRLPDFCIGVVVGRAYYLLHIKNSLLIGRGYLLYVPAMVLELMVLTHGHSVRLPFMSNGLLLPFHGLLILGLALGGGCLANSLSNRTLVFLGNASYAMYILHSPTAQWFDVVAKRVYPMGLGNMAGYVLLVICLSAIVFSVIEEPANRVVKQWLTARFYCITS